MGNSKSGGEDDVTANGKYLLISVPEFAEDPVKPGRKMTSYLRLGAASSTWQTDPGGDLAANVNLSGPPGGAGDPPGEEVSYANDGAGPNTAPAGGGGGEGGPKEAGPAPDGTRPVFVDDKRERGAAAPHSMSVGERLDESAHLHSRGGWRDHSDGNRITTTYGDKIEVIRGNYKLVVLGRQDDPAACAGLDISGNHIQDFAYTWPAFQRVEWTSEYGGVWHIQNTTDGAVTSENFGGDSYEFRWGNRFESTTGSENPVEIEAAAPPAPPRPRGNPHIIEKTWAKQIESYTGSAAWRIPLIKEETWAVETTDATDVSGSTTSTTTVGGSVTETTTVGGAVTETTTVGGAITSTTTAGAIVETTTAGAITGVTSAGTIVGVTTADAIADVTLAANKTEVFVGATHVNVEVAAKLDIFLGAVVAIEVGPKLEITWPNRVRKSIPDEVEASLNKIRTAMVNADVGLMREIIAIQIRLGM